MLLRALFLDRDGVVIKEKGYIREANLVELVPGVSNLMKAARALNMRVILVTNQSGIGRGWVDFKNYLEVSHRMVELLDDEGAHFDQIFFAPYFIESPIEKNLHQINYVYAHPPTLKTAQGPLENRGHWHSSWRKPELGMINEAQKLFQLQLSQCVMIGDRISDMELAGRGNFKKSYLIKSPEFLKDGSSERKHKWQSVIQLYPQTQFQIITELAEIDSQQW